MPEHVELDMIPALLDSQHLQEWVDLCEEFVAQRPEWKTKVLASLLACTLHNDDLYRLFHEKTKDGVFNDWPEVWNTMRNAYTEIKQNYMSENGAAVNQQRRLITGLGGVPFATAPSHRFAPYSKMEVDSTGKTIEKKLYTCDVCNREFRRPEHLKRHYRSIHTDEKPYECVYCGKKFSRSDNLAQHERSHTRKKRGLGYEEPDAEAAAAAAVQAHAHAQVAHAAHVSHHALHHHHHPEHHGVPGDATTTADIALQAAAAVVAAKPEDVDDANVAATLKAATQGVGMDDQ